MKTTSRPMPYSSSVGNIDGMYLDSMLFYPLEAGGCKNCFLDADDAKFHYTAQGKMTHWETGWTEK